MLSSSRMLRVTLTAGYGPNSPPGGSVWAGAGRGVAGICVGAGDLGAVVAAGWGGVVFGAAEGFGASAVACGLWCTVPFVRAVLGARGRSAGFAAGRAIAAVRVRAATGAVDCATVAGFAADGSAGSLTTCTVAAPPPAKTAVDAATAAAFCTPAVSNSERSADHTRAPSQPAAPAAATPADRSRTVAGASR